jgi:PIN domain nuclease of toxin-antitoxin system
MTLFDWILVQALTEDAALVSRDEPLSQYGVTIV